MVVYAESEGDEAAAPAEKAEESPPAAEDEAPAAPSQEATPDVDEPVADDVVAVATEAPLDGDAEGEADPIDDKVIAPTRRRMAFSFDPPA